MKSKSPDAASSQDSNKTYMDSPELIAELDCHVQYQVRCVFVNVYSY